MVSTPEQTAPNPTGPNTTTPPTPPPPVTPLQDPAFQAVLAQSPTLRQDLQQLRHDGYTVEWGTAGAGTFYDKAHTRIVIDRNEIGQGSAIAQSLSHEIGHHTFHEPVDYSSRAAYVTHQLRNEGAATLHNAEVRDEIRAAGGPDIGIAGANAATYARIAGEHHAGRIDRNTALGQIANAFGTEHPSVAAGGDYNAYYGNFYDTNLVPWLRSTGQLPQPAQGGPALDQGHPAAPMFTTLRGQFPPGVSDAHVLDAAVKAQAEGIRPDQAKAVTHDNTAWVASTQTPGIRVQTDLAAPPPPVGESLERSQRLAGDAQAQAQQHAVAPGR
jgi:hypothetical protein